MIYCGRIEGMIFSLADYHTLEVGLTVSTPVYSLAQGGASVLASRSSRETKYVKKSRVHLIAWGSCPSLFSGASPTIRGLAAPVAVDLRKGFRWNSGLLISDC